MLVAFINYFPNLEHLCILGHVRVRSGLGKSEEALHFVRPLRKLSVSVASIGPPNAIESLSELGLCVDELILLPSFQPWETSSRRIISEFGAVAKCLRFPQIPSCYDELDLSYCLELRELEFVISTSHPCVADLDIISSVTSTKIEKITIVITGPEYLLAQHFCLNLNTD